MIYQCLQCGGPYKTPPSKYAKKGRKYCSSKCYGMSLLTQIQKTCQTCGKTYPTRPQRPSRFCSNQCQGVSDRSQIGATCAHCQKVVSIPPSRRPRFRFCSKSCKALALFVGTTIGVKALNRSSRPTPYEKPGYVKLAGRIRKRDGYRCQICSRQFAVGERGLEVDHRIPIRSGGTDKPENLWALCAPCHRRKDNALRLAELRS